MEIANTVKASKITLLELRFPSNSNFSGKIHGGYLLKLMNQIVFTYASKYSGCHCEKAYVDRVDFIKPDYTSWLVKQRMVKNMRKVFLKEN